MSEFFAMGGYAVYVWSSYGLAALILVGLLIASVATLRTQERTLQALEAAQGQRRRRAGKGAAEEGTP